MDSNDIIAIIIIVTVCLATIAYFIIKNNGINNRVNSVIKSYPSFVKVLLNCETIPAQLELSKEQRDKILSITDEEWKEWETISNKAVILAGKYPYTLFEFINELFPEYKERVNFKGKVNLFAPVQKKVKMAVASLLLEELRKIDSDTETVWKEREELRLNATKIKQKYPEGYNAYCKINENNSPKDIELVKEKKRIAELQKLYDESKGYEGWEKKQEEFCSDFWQILKDVRSQDGRYTYNISFKKPTRDGTLTDSKFKVWQGFCESYSSYLLDKQTEEFKARYDRIPLFEKRTRYFYDRVYEQIFSMITKLKEKISGDLGVILINRCKRNWSEITYNYHYRHISELLAETENDVLLFEFSDLPFIKDNGNLGGIFILDFITTNEELKSNCKLIIEHFNKSVPLLGYYSMLKEFDEKELLKVAENHDGYLDSEEKDVEFIKNCLLQVRKHSFFSYLAIPNTWIGEAGGAESTKRTWLDNPTKYQFVTNDEDGYISGSFSVDGGESYEDISIEGDSFDVDDTAKFTYHLLKKMGVLSQFKKNSQKAIQHMNRDGLLAHHY